MAGKWSQKNVFFILNKPWPITFHNQTLSIRNSESVYNTCTFSGSFSELGAIPTGTELGAIPTGTWQLQCLPDTRDWYRQHETYIQCNMVTIYSANTIFLKLDEHELGAIPTGTWQLQCLPDTRDWYRQHEAYIQCNMVSIYSANTIFLKNWLSMNMSMSMGIRMSMSTKHWAWVGAGAFSLLLATERGNYTVCLTHGTDIENMNHIYIETWPRYTQPYY